MFKIGDRVLYNGEFAILLIAKEEEVLILECDNFVKWVEKDSIEELTVA